jgi:carbonic anhydrase/acetyltransferase-like protein (isoleucine patch superfamily)
VTHIGDGTRIGYRTHIGDRTHIGVGTHIGDRTYIGNRTHIGDEVHIGDGALIGDGASIGDGVFPVVIHIIGSRYSLSYWGEDRIDIGCEKRSIQDWLTGEDIAKRYDFKPDEITEYRSYVEFIARIHSGEAVR